MLFHDGKVYGVTSRKLPIPENNLLRTFDTCPIDGEHLVDDAEHSVKRRLDSITPVDGHVAVEDFLKHFRIDVSRGRPSSAQERRPTIARETGQ